MKVFMKPIEMIAWFTLDGCPRPIRFRMLQPDHSSLVVKVDRIVDQKEEKLAGNRMMVFICQSIIEGVQRIYELKYEISTCKWFLYKL